MMRLLSFVLGEVIKSLKRILWLKNFAYFELPILIADLEQKGTSKKNADEEMLFSELVDEYMKRSELRRKETTCGTKENIIKNRILPFFSDKSAFLHSSLFFLECRRQYNCQLQYQSRMTRQKSLL